MRLVVPDEIDGIDAVLAGLDPDALSPEALEAFGPAQIEVVMPKFEVRSSAPLRDPLIGLGAVETFDRHLSDLARLAPIPPQFDNIYVSDVVHEAWIRVDEAGTEASAATTVEIEGTDSASAVPSVVRADRPFAYFIRDRVTGVLLFAGRMDAPPEATSN
jgi:serpin B